MIQFIHEDIQLPDFDTQKTTCWIRKIAADYDKKLGSVNYVFCTDERILEVNKQYLNHDYYTDIITFDYSEKNFIAGDIFISIDTVRANANEFAVSFENELLRIIIHGILHLCGQDDSTTELRAEMTEKENIALGKFTE